MMLITIDNVIDFVSNFRWREWLSTGSTDCYDVDIYSKYKWDHSRANLRASEFRNVIDFILI